MCRVVVTWELYYNSHHNHSHYFAVYISIRHQSLIGCERHISCEGVKCVSFSFCSAVVTVHLLLWCHYFAVYISIWHQSLTGCEHHISCEGVKFVSFSFLSEVVTVHLLLWCDYFVVYISIRRQSLASCECHISCEGVKFVSFFFSLWSGHCSPTSPVSLLCGVYQHQTSVTDWSWMSH